MEIKIGIIGFRSYNNGMELYDTIDKFIKTHQYDKITIVSGGADGADKLGASYALAREYDLIEYRPDWEKYGKSAGMIRNTSIVETADVLFAFWDGESKGTQDSIKKAIKMEKPCFVIIPNQKPIINLPTKKGVEPFLFD